MRGKVRRGIHSIADRGITPACAGKRSRGRHPPSPCPDHPRVCREKRFCDERRKALAGSPPRVRGKVLRPARDFLNRGITPACAGKRPSAGASPAAARDHPRVCGEKMTGSVIYPPGRGSPPRVRGKERGEIHIFPLVRIPPGWAGKSVRALPYMHWWTGSPPRVRGKDALARRHPQATGITPACAGKRLQSVPAKRPIWDHPRVCGEKLTLSQSEKYALGSPPRVRGKVRDG